LIKGYRAKEFWYNPRTMFRLHDPLTDAVREALKEYDDLTAGLLSRRGVSTAAEATAFLNPSYEEHIGDPLKILNMPRAAERIADAIRGGERIAVWSDYDCDGIPGGTLLHDFLKKAGANFTNYIPHRHEEGFGVNVGGVERLAEEGTSVMITVDCGITDVVPIARAKELGMDVILTDHHLPHEELPPAFAVIDPKQEGETNAFRDFCGGGLAWKLACAVLVVGRARRDAWTKDIPEGWEKWLLDMAGLATIADMVPLVGENRVIAKYGLLVMRKSPRIGLQKLCSVARVNQRFITEDDVGFMLAPRVNAASRMGNPRDAFELFTTTDESRADALAKELEKANRSRRAHGASITRAAKERLEERAVKGTLPPVIAMGDPDWRPGLLGLVANSLAEEYERPVFLWGREGGTTLKGSCRAGRKGVSVVSLIEAAVDTFVSGGGHAASGGFTLRDDAVFDFETRMEQALASLSLAETTSEPLAADRALTIDEANHALLKRLERLAPFGMGNPKPVFVLRDAQVARVSWFGKAEEHLKLTVTEDFGTIEAVSFYAKRELGSACKSVVPGGHHTLLGSLERDQFARGQPVRLRLVALG
jgi:single-stranded-DNA-specific exonuclease